MKTHLKILFLSITILSFLTGSSQVSKRVVVEHFTNSVCGTCASRNPGLFSNIDAQDSVLHIAFHPSSPYPSCVFNTHNVSENNGRTNYYGIFGLTPRIVIQGSPISAAANYNAAAIFSPFINQTSPFSIKVEQYKVGGDSVRCRVVIKTEAAHNLPATKLFVALAENPVLYSAPNGENTHRNVFRKAFTAIDGDDFAISSSIGDSAVYVKTTAISNVWNFNAVHTMAILQESSNKATIQAAISKSGDGTPMSVTKIENDKPFQIFPNPTSDFLILRNTSKIETSIALFNTRGQIIYQGEFVEEMTLTTSELASGLYFIRFKSNDKTSFYKFIVSK